MDWYLDEPAAGAKRYKHQALLPCIYIEAVWLGKRTLDAKQSPPEHGSKVVPELDASRASARP